MNEIQIEEEKEIEGELEELEVEEKARTIYVDKRDWPIDAICNRIQQGELELQPEFQRQYVWDDKRASLFVESILMGLPTPVIYLAEDQEGKLLTIDGQQRLKSIYRFWRNEFALRGLTVFKEFNGKRFRDLDRRYQRDFLNGTIRVIVIKRESNNDVKFELFERLNTGSVHLNAQELRNCIYRGPYNDLIRELARDEDFLSLLGLREPDRRMRDCELVLRFFAFYHTPYYRYNPPMKKFLNDEMERHRNIGSEEANELKAVFRKSVELTKTVFGDKAFRRFVRGTEQDRNGFWESKVNKALYDVIMHGFTLYDKRQVVLCSDAVREELLWLMTQDDDFIRSITVSTDKREHVHIHFRKWLDSLGDVLGFPQTEPRTFSLNYKRQLWESDPICQICGNRIQTIDDAEVDHVDFYWRGGKTIPSNARLVHRYCNRSRGRHG